MQPPHSTLSADSVHPKLPDLLRLFLSLQFLLSPAQHAILAPVLSVALLTPEPQHFLPLPLLLPVLHMPDSLYPYQNLLPATSALHHLTVFSSALYFLSPASGSPSLLPHFLYSQPRKYSELPEFLHCVLLLFLPVLSGSFHLQQSLPLPLMS